MKSSAKKLISITLVALVVAAVVFSFVVFNNKNKLDPALEGLLQNASCRDAEDQNLCLFLAVWNNNPTYTLNASENKGEQNFTHQLKSASQDFWLTIDGEQDRQTIYKDSMLYVLNGSWQHQESSSEDSVKFREANELAFIKSDNFDNFKHTGSEKCFEQDCLTYELTNVGNKTKVWFDTTNFRLQRVLIQGDNYNYNATVDYNSEVKIDAPLDSKVLTSGQHLAPGGGQTSSTQTSEPGLAATGDNSLPATGDSGNPEEYQQWMKQRQQ